MGDRGKGWDQVTTGNSPSARFGHSAVHINGKVYLYGGKNPSQGVLGDLWVYQSDPPQWTQRTITATNKPAARYKHAAAVSGGKMYVFFGRDGQGNLLSDVWVHDPISNTWTQKNPGGAEKPPARELHTATTLADGRIIVNGGKDNLAIVDGFVWIYDPQNDTWQKGLECPPGGRYSHGSQTIGGKVYFFAGTSSQGATNEVWVYDPANNTCTKITPITFGAPPKREFVQTASNGRNTVWMFGGQSHTGMSAAGLLAPSAILQDAWALYLSNDTAWWTQESSGAPAVMQSATAYLPATGQVLLFGGRDTGGNVVNQTWAYTPGAIAPACYDFNGDNQVNTPDIQTIANRWRETVLGPVHQFDLDDDGRITILDIMWVAVQWQQVC